MYMHHAQYMHLNMYVTVQLSKTGLHATYMLFVVAMITGVLILCLH